MLVNFPLSEKDLALLRSCSVVFHVDKFTSVSPVMREGLVPDQENHLKHDLMLYDILKPTDGKLKWPQSHRLYIDRVNLLFIYRDMNKYLTLLHLGVSPLVRREIDVKIAIS